MNQLVRLLPVSVISVFLVAGCFHHRAVLTVSDTSAASHDRALNAFLGVCEEFSFAPDPRFEEIRQDSLESSSTDNVVLAMCRTPQSAPEWIEARAVRSKAENYFAVIVSEHDLPTASLRAQNFERRLEAALANELPEVSIKTESGTTGPVLGP